MLWSENKTCLCLEKIFLCTSYFKIHFCFPFRNCGKHVFKSLWKDSPFCSVGLPGSCGPAMLRGAPWYSRVLWADVVWQSLSVFSCLTSYQELVEGLPWWFQESLTTCLCQGKGQWFDPWFGKIPHAWEKLSPDTTTTELHSRAYKATDTEAQVPRACALQQEKPLQWETRTQQLEYSPALWN